MVGMAWVQKTMNHVRIKSFSSVASLQLSLVRVERISRRVVGFMHTMSCKHAVQIGTQLTLLTSALPWLLLICLWFSGPPACTVMGDALVDLPCLDQCPLSHRR